MTQTLTHSTSSLPSDVFSTNIIWCCLVTPHALELVCDRHMQLNRSPSLVCSQSGSIESQADSEATELPSWMHLKLTSKQSSLEEEMEIQRSRSSAIPIIQPTGLARIMQAVLPCECGPETRRVFSQRKLSPSYNGISHHIH